MKLKKALSCIAVVLAMSAALTSCQASKTIEVEPVRLETQLDASIPLLTGDNSAALLQNIDRGFRMEVYYTLGSGRAWPEDEGDGYASLNAVLARFTEEDPREIQVYIYLTEYYNKPLDDKAFEQLENYLSYLRGKQLGVLLRFAYDPAQPYENSPTEEQLLAHIAQIKDWMAAHRDLVNDTVTAYQMGFIGAWGEWGSSSQEYDRKKIALAICDMVPAGTYLQGRYLHVTNLTKNAPNADYVGFHNDFLVGRPHAWNTAGDKNYTPGYKAFAKAAPLRINDGEMPWVGATQEPDEQVDGKKFIKQCYEHHFATLSIEHNYKEIRNVEVRPDQYNIARWKTEPITAADLKELGCPYYDSWFTDASGAPMTRTVYDYLRDFLGYHLVLSNLKTEGNQFSFMVTNMGLGTPLTLDKLEFVVRDKATGKETRLPVAEFDPKQLVTGGQQTFRVTVPGSLENAAYGVAILREKSAGGDYAIRCANNIPFENGVNLIKP